MEDQSSKNKAAVSGSTFTIAVLLNGIVAMVAAGRFGLHVHGDVMNSFARTDLLASAGRFFLLVLVVLS